MEKILKNDLEKYNTDEFEEKIKKIFLKVQKAWSDNRPEDLINIESSLLYEREAEKIRRHISKNLREVRKNIVFNYIDVTEHYIAGTAEVLKVKIRASMENYIYNIITGEVVSGIREYKEIKKYILTMVKRGEKEGFINIKCDGCGANVSIMALGKCEYCGTLFYTKEYDWILEDIEVYPDDEENYY